MAHRGTSAVGGMSVRRAITLTPDGNVIVLRGYRVAQLARQAGLRPTFAGSVGGWMVDAHRLPDLVAWLDYRHVAYELDRDVNTGVRNLTPETPAGEQAPTPDDGLW